MIKVNGVRIIPIKASLKNELLKLEKTLLDPEVRSNPEEIKKYLAADFFEFGSSGRIWTLVNQLREEGLEKSEPRKLLLYDFEVHLLAEEVALVTYKVNDETRNQHTLRSSIWKYVDQKWQMFFHQGTITKEK